MPYGRVLVVLPALVLHDVALSGERRLVDVVEQEPHAVALEPERELQAVRGDGLEVVGAVGAGRPVDVARAGPARGPEVGVLGTCLLPWNITCSKRCAKPFLPAGSSFEPTWYQRLTVTMGVRWSSWRMTSRPLSRRGFFTWRLTLRVGVRRARPRTAAPLARTTRRQARRDRGRWGGRADERAWALRERPAAYAQTKRS